MFRVVPIITKMRFNHFVMSKTVLYGQKQHKIALTSRLPSAGGNGYKIKDNDKDFVPKWHNRKNISEDQNSNISSQQ